METEAEKKAIRFYFACVKYGARASHCPQEAEEFAAWAYLTGHPHFSRPIKYLWIDFLRERLGRPGSPNFEAKHALAKAGGLEDQPEVSCAAVDPGDELDIAGLFHLLKGSDRAIMKLIHDWGFTNGEVGDCFGVTESRISQRLVAIKAILSGAMESQESGETSRIPQAVQRAQARALRREQDFPECSKEAVARVLRPKESDGSQLGSESYQGLAAEESGTLEGLDEACFDEWLT